MEILILDFTASHLLVPQGWAGSWVPLLTMALIRWLSQQKEARGARLGTVCECRGGTFLGTGTQRTSSYPFSPLPRIPSLSCQAWSVLVAISRPRAVHSREASGLCFRCADTSRQTGSESGVTARKGGRTGFII